MELCYLEQMRVEVGLEQRRYFGCPMGVSFIDGEQSS